ncbi:MAG: serine--tRNA ligase [Candidatus Methanomethyliaceae archaeon]|nr:serine--tRNA ligase [Candidatus Methanomethyliaceae archaeon]MDW7971118.1 serine--tRNA ligase [Nitrososphaerota archaeon]
MLDIKMIRKDPDKIRRNLARREDPKVLQSFDELIECDRNWRIALNQLNKLRSIRNKITEEIAKLKKEGLDVSQKMKEADEIVEKIKEKEVEVKEYEKRMEYLLKLIPNIMAEDVPIGRDEKDNVVIRTWGEIRQFNFKVKDHIDLSIDLDLVDLERAAKVAGARFYYLKKDLVMLNLALIKYGLNFMIRKGFIPFLTPYMLRREIVEGAVALSDFEEMIYKIEGEDLYLVATSEHALLGLHANEVLDGNKLPLRYCGISPCFRKEAGAHGRDTKGIFRVHQFEKVEQFVFCKPEDSPKEHELLLRNAEEFIQSLGLPYRVVNICSGELGTVAAKKYDIEVWLPAQGRYREMVSCSNCYSYQAVRSNIRYKDKPGEPPNYVHTLNSTLVATERTIVAILENYQQEDGSVLIPKVLVPYMDGQEIIKRM